MTLTRFFGGHLRGSDGGPDRPELSRRAVSFDWKPLASFIRNSIQLGIRLSNPKGDLTSGPNGELIAIASVLARWLNLNGKAVYDLAKAGVLVRLSRDHFLLEESVRRYCDYVRRSKDSERTENKRTPDP